MIDKIKNAKTFRELRDIEIKTGNKYIKEIKKQELIIKKK